MNIDLQKNWWIVNVVAGVVGIAVDSLADQYFPSAAPYTSIFFLTLVGLSFLWVFNTKKEIWWSVAPGVGVLSLAVAGVVNLFIPENNGWVATLILGVAGFVIAALPNPRPEIKITYLIATLILVIGFLMAPLPTLWKIVSCVVCVMVGGYFTWLNRRHFQ